MSKTNIPTKIQNRLWGKAAGRCQYPGCNRPLWHDSVTKSEINVSYIAHIVADSPGGPRGDPKQSEALKTDINNLMLLCDEHHRLIDKEEEQERHTVEYLHAIKRAHEEQMALVTDICNKRQSHVLLYGANIGQQNALVSMNAATLAMQPDWYPAEVHPIELSLINSPFRDHETPYWEIEKAALTRQFSKLVQPRLATNTIDHISIFALAPQPLLILLGSLVTDIPQAEVYQLQREPPNWIWRDNKDDDLQFLINNTNGNGKQIALNLSLSATINNDRIYNTLGTDVPIWTITIEKPHNDFLKSRHHLSSFRKSFRALLNNIKAIHGEDAIIHVFPATPTSIAVDIGRTRMPKADLPMVIYDQNNEAGGFLKTFLIGNIS